MGPHSNRVIILFSDDNNARMMLSPLRHEFSNGAIIKRGDIRDSFGFRQMQNVKPRSELRNQRETESEKGYSSFCRTSRRMEESLIAMRSCTEMRGNSSLDTTSKLRRAFHQC